MCHKTKHRPVGWGCRIHNVKMKEIEKIDKYLALAKANKAEGY